MLAVVTPHNVQLKAKEVEMKKILILLVLVFSNVTFNHHKEWKVGDVLHLNKLTIHSLFAYAPPPSPPDPVSIVSVVGQQMDSPVEDTIIVTIDSLTTPPDCIKLKWLVSGYPAGINIGNTMLTGAYAADSSYVVADDFPEDATIFISAWTGDVDGDTTWSEDYGEGSVYLAKYGWPQYGYKHFKEELARHDSTRVRLATADYLMTPIEDVSDEYDDDPYEWIQHWQQIINLNPNIIRLAYVTPPFCSRAVRDTTPFWHGFMRQLYEWDENDGVCFYFEPDTISIAAATDSDDAYIVVDHKDSIQYVDSRGIGLSEFTGAVRYRYLPSGTTEQLVDYILWNGWADGADDKDTLFLLNQTNPESYPRMGTDNVNNKVLNKQVTSFQDWGFNIVSVLVLMNENRPAIDDTIKFEHVLAESSHAWITNQAVFGTSPNDTAIFEGVYYDLLNEDPINAVSAAVDTSGINDFLQTQWERFGDNFYFGGNSQQVDDIRMDIMNKFDHITAGELDWDERFGGPNNEKDKLMQEIHSTLIAKRIYHEDGSNDVPFTILWDDHGGDGTHNIPTDSSDWDDSDTTMAWHRLNLAVTTIFDGMHSVKKGPYFYDNQDCWMDEYAVDDSGYTIRLIEEVGDTLWQFVADWSTYKHWLGAPVDDNAVIVGTTLEVANRISNYGFEDSTTSWSTQNVTAIDDTTYKTEGNASAKLFPTNSSSANFYQTGVDISTGTIYTFSFDVMSTENREIKFGIARSGTTLVDQDKIAVGKAWTTYTSTFDTQGYEDSTYVFGFNLKDQSDTVWIDNCKLQLGEGFYGYSRKYENGWVGVNLSGSEHVFDVEDSTYQKIGGEIDPVHNDTSLVDSTLTIGPMDAYFLFKTE